MRLDDDPELSALRLVLDLETLSSQFEEVWSQSQGQRLAVTECRRIDTAYEPGVRCVAAYELTGKGPGDEHARSLGVLDIDPSGATHRMFPEDPELPSLAAAASHDFMLERLAALPADVSGLPVIDRCEITPVRYKPGQRCALRYDLSSRGKRTALFGKLVAVGGHRLLATLVALHEASEAAPAIPRVPRPLFYWPDLGLVVQPAVTASTLTARALEASSPAGTGARWMASAGSGLAAVHRAVTASGPRRTLQDDLRELQDHQRLFGRLAPELARPFDDAVTALRRYALASSEPTPVASHGALRTDQFLIDGRDLLLIDLDSYCWATPARDMGNLLAYLDWRAIRRPENAALLVEARRAFLEGYAAVAPLPDSAWLEAFRAGSMLKIAGRRLRGLSFEEWELLPKLLDAARDKLPV